MAKLSGPMLPPLSGTARQAIVLLHGYGADGNDLIDLGRHWGQLFPDALFVAPNAPRPCGGNPFGFEWFPLQVDRIAGRIEGAKQAAPLLVGIALADELAGIVAFSGAFVPADDFETGNFAKPPVALIHGDLDQVVDPALSRQAAADLVAAGFEVGLHISPGTGHGIAPDGLEFATSLMLARII